ncbi:hypothetical protein B0H14DRAFT_3500999 [Mycena olivaceomarginata]|nr:hypothetical protein B0H14DRAFT_3500999 [Mycena olivaceomarginata]
MSAFEKLISCCKFFMRAVHPYVTLTEVMLYGPDKHWGTAPAICPSNIVSVSPAEIERQDACVKVFDKMFSIASELLPVIKQIYLEITVKPQQWQMLVKVMREAATSARTSDTNSLKHELIYFLPNSLKDVLTSPIPKQESKSDRGLNHPVLRYLILGCADRAKLPPLVFGRAPATNMTSSAASSFPPPDAGDAASPGAGAASPSAPDTGAASSSATDAAVTEFLKRIVEGKVPLKTRTYPSCFYAEDSYDPTNLDKGFAAQGGNPSCLAAHLDQTEDRHCWRGEESAPDMQRPPSVGKIKKKPY